MTPINIKGMKFSSELVLIRLQNLAPESRLLPAFSGMMAGSRINMSYLTTEIQSGGLRAACCVDATHQALVKRLIDLHPELPKHVKYQPGVGLLTLFPHYSSLSLFSLSMYALAKANLRVFTLSSSIGALTFALEYSRLDKAAEALQKCFKLTNNHAPFRSEFTVSQATQTRSENTE